MSIPKIQTSVNPVSREQALTDIIESIALEETALAHILNAEGEKIQKAVECICNKDGLIEVNESVNDTIKNIIKLQMLLQFKLEEAEGIIGEEE
jgi:hypothetical protein